MTLFFTKHLFYTFNLDAYTISSHLFLNIDEFLYNINVDVTEIKTQAKQSLFLNVGYPVLKQQQNNLYTVDGLRP